MNMKIDKQTKENEVTTTAQNIGFTFVRWADTYKGVKTKAIISCDVHGEWSVQADSFTRKKSKCAKCAILDRTTPETEVIDKINNLGRDKYTFVRWGEDYKGSMTRVIIKCSDHGEWDCKLNSFLSDGSRCKRCADDYKVTNEQDRLHTILSYCKDKEYSFINWVGEYKGSNTRCIINCHTHGDWEVRSSSFIRGHHCPSCGNYGYDNNKTGYVYVLKSECGAHFKVGITNDTSRRINELTKRTPFNFETVHVMAFDDGQIARIVEKTFHSCFESSLFTGFDGATEWRNWNDDVTVWIKYITPKMVINESRRDI